MLHNIKHRQWLSVLVWSTGFFGILVLLHMVFPSMLNTFHLKDVSFGMEHTFITEAYQYHLEHPVFARRPIISGLLFFLTSVGMSFGWAFVLIQGVFFVSSSLLIYVLARHIRLSHDQAVLSMVSFFLSFSVFAAFFAPVFTYDDLAQIFFLVLSVYLLLRFRLAWSVLAFFLACLARETSMFFLPAFALIYLHLRADTHVSFVKRLLPFGFLYGGAVIFYICCIYFLLMNMGLLEAGNTYIVQERFTHWEYNFQSKAYAVEVFVSFILALGWQMSFFLWYVKDAWSMMSATQKRLFYGAGIVFFLNTPLVLLATRAQEVRLIALPLVLVWPLSGLAVEHVIVCIKNFLKKLQEKSMFQVSILCVITVLFFAMSYYFAYSVYTPTSEWTPASLFRLYALAATFFGAIIWLIPSYEKNS